MGEKVVIRGGEKLVFGVYFKGDLVGNIVVILSFLVEFDREFVRWRYSRNRTYGLVFVGRWFYFLGGVFFS